VNHDYDHTLFERFKQEYLRRLEEEITEHHVLRHHHVDEAVAYFSQPGFIPGLLTGNFPDAAVIKLKTARIYLDYQIGAFGEHHKDRNQLPFLAMSSLQEMLAVEPDPQKFVIIGDTPRDIECARHAGMRSVAVTTGSYTAQQLLEHDPDLVIEDLSDPQNWFEKLIRTS
jgi:phosphoglycolate phosphatase-like HAD superfamily hydrolase